MAFIDRAFGLAETRRKALPMSVLKQIQALADRFGAALLLATAAVVSGALLSAV